MGNLISYLQYPFVVNAIIVGTLVALCAGLIGVVLVSKKMTFMGETLSHTVFLISIITSVLGLVENLFINIVITTIITLMLMKQSKNASGDSKLAMISTASLGLGFLILNMYGKSANMTADVCAVLFGSTAILNLSSFDVAVSIILAFTIIGMYIIFYNKIFAITFDEDFSKATGVDTNNYRYIIAAILSVIIALGVNVVGSLLISALIIYPVMAAKILCKSFKVLVILSAVIAGISAIAGMCISIVGSLPIGPSIIAVNVLMYLLILVCSKIVRR